MWQIKSICIFRWIPRTNSHLTQMKIKWVTMKAYAFYWCFKSRANEFCIASEPLFSCRTIRNTSSSVYDFRGHTKNFKRNRKTVCHFVMDYLNKSRKFLVFLCCHCNTLGILDICVCVWIFNFHLYFIVQQRHSLSMRATYIESAEFIIAIKSIDAVHYQQFRKSWQLKPNNRNIKSDNFKPCAKQRVWFWSWFFFNFCLSA